MIVDAGNQSLFPSLYWTTKTSLRKPRWESVTLPLAILAPQPVPLPTLLGISHSSPRYTGPSGSLSGAGAGNQSLFPSLYWKAIAQVLGTSWESVTLPLAILFAPLQIPAVRLGISHSSPRYTGTRPHHQLTPAGNQSLFPSLYWPAGKTRPPTRWESVTLPLAILGRTCERLARTLGISHSSPRYTGEGVQVSFCGAGNQSLFPSLYWTPGRSRVRRSWESVTLPLAILGRSVIGRAIWLGISHSSPRYTGEPTCSPRPPAGNQSLFPSLYWLDTATSALTGWESVTLPLAILVFSVLKILDRLGISHSSPRYTGRGRVFP